MDFVNMKTAGIGIGIGIPQLAIAQWAYQYPQDYSPNRLHLHRTERTKVTQHLF